MRSRGPAGTGRHQRKAVASSVQKCGSRLRWPSPEKSAGEVAAVGRKAHARSTKDLVANAVPGDDAHGHDVFCRRSCAIQYSDQLYSRGCAGTWWRAWAPRWRPSWWRPEPPRGRSSWWQLGPPRRWPSWTRQGPGLPLPSSWTRSLLLSLLLFRQLLLREQRVRLSLGVGHSRLV
jgi:hypothetical protein